MLGWAPDGTLKVVSWNPQTAHTAARLEDISSVFKRYQCVVLQGTQRRSSGGNGATVSNVFHHHAIYFGHCSSVRETGPHGGITSMLHNKFFDNHFHTIAIPEDVSIVGMVGLLRVKIGTAIDVTVVGVCPTSQGS